MRGREQEKRVKGLIPRLDARSERGYAAVLVAVMFPVVFLALAAIAVDTANVYVEAQKLQNAADAGALAGVVYLPQDMTNATTTARAVALRNGFTHDADGVSVTVEQGARPSQLKVTVETTVTNTFGQLIGSPTTTISRSAVSDYTGPAPMGSPCNTFGNEPTSGGGPLSATPAGSVLPSPPFSNCTSSPNFWAVVEGPETGKLQGDRYQTLRCEDSSVTVSGCTNHVNDDYDKRGYFFVVKVLKDAVNQPVRLQLYDPAFVTVGQRCETATGATASTTNNYTADPLTRYGNSSAFCSGDSYPGSGGSNPMTTSFVLRQQTDTQDPMKGAAIAGCTKQFGSYTRTVRSAALDQSDPAYNDQLAKVFHNWVDFCTFTPSREGDYYLQVRTNVSTGGTPETTDASNLIWSGNANAAAPVGNSTSGGGSNGFAIRASTPNGLEKQVSVAGWDRMPIFVNANTAASTFNLIRVLPAARGQYIEFTFFDAADAVSSGQGTFTVLAPDDATGTIKSTPYPQGCSAPDGPVTGNLTNCSLVVKSSTHNGKLQTMRIPIPTDYSCDDSTQGGCWFRVSLDYNGTQVTDVTTWDATIEGDPVRLIK